MQREHFKEKEEEEKEEEEEEDETLVTNLRRTSEFHARNVTE